MRKRANELRANMRIAKAIWGHLSERMRRSLQELVVNHSLSVASGDLQQIEGRWYVTHSGLLRVAQRRRCVGIRVQEVEKFCDPMASRWIFRATVFKTTTSKGFVGYGDADPSNVSSVVRGAEMRVAETRAVNRALRKAYGIGLCSVEELGWVPKPSGTDKVNQSSSSSARSNGQCNNGQPRLRDRLCLLIRQHQLDANLVKAYAADYCGTATLREASRDSIEAFINDLSERAVKDRDGLLCHLNSYAKHEEVSK